MKTALLVFLFIIAGLLGIDDYLQHTKAAAAEKDSAAAQEASKQATVKSNAYNFQVENLKGQIQVLQQQKTELAAAVAAAAQTPTPTPPPVAANATPTPAPTPEATGLTATQLVEKYSNALAIIEGQKAVGSGFICTMDGHTYAVTNAHVLCDNPSFKVTGLKGTVYTVGASAVAVGRDMVKLEVTGAEKAFEVADKVDSVAKIGDAVTVLGNSEGAGVVKPVDGKIVGIGPELIEVDAQFVKGNSGSPIIHQATGKVLGVATYLVERKVDQGQGGGVQTEIRRFGYRIDGIKQWQKIDWRTFYAQSAELTAMETLSNDFVKMFGDTGNGLNFDPASYASPALQRSIRSFAQAIQNGGKTMSLSDRKTLVERFIGDLRSVSHADIVSFNRNTAYDYFLREVDDESRFRDEIYQGLTRPLQNMQ